MSSNKKLYVRTTTDEYELPIAVADSAGELAEMLGTTKAGIFSSIAHKCKGWYRLELEEEYED